MCLSTISIYLLRRNIYFPPTGHTLEKTTIQKDTCIPTFTAAMLTTTRTWKQPNVYQQRNGQRRCGTYIQWNIQFSSVQSLSHVRLFATPWIAARQASLSTTNSWNSFRLKSIESVKPSSHLILCRPLLLLPPIPPSIRVFSNESTLLMRWPKYCSFSFSIIPSQEIPGLISFRMDWLDLLAVQGTLKSLLQQKHLYSKPSILRRSAFFTVQLSHPYMTTGKTIALTRRTFVGKVMSLLLNILSITSHKKEWEWVICRDVDGPRVYHVE